MTIRAVCYAFLPIPETPNDGLVAANPISKTIRTSILLIEKPIGKVGWSTFMAGFAFLAVAAELKEGAAEKPDAHFEAAIQSLASGGVRGPVRIAFDEWNLRSWHHPGFSGHRPRKVDYADSAVIALIKAREKSDNVSLSTMADALFSASFLNAYLHHSSAVAMANIAPLVNTSGPHKDGIVKRTHFHTMAMYANLLEDHVASSRVTVDRLTHRNQSVAAVDAVATVNKSGEKWAITLVNPPPVEVSDFHVLVDGTPPYGTFTVTLLTGDSPDAHNDIGRPDRVKPQESTVSSRQGILRLPPHPLMIIRNLTQGGEKPKYEQEN